jgi:hypothetical protein
MHSKTIDSSGAFGARKTCTLEKMDLQDPTNSDTWIILEHVILCGTPITNEDWSRATRRRPKRHSPN